jgi:RNA polymerase sigma factor (sigma-70 family)
LPYDDKLGANACDPFDHLGLDEAMTGLERLDPVQAKVAELRYFCGLTIDETAKVLGVSTGKVNREWRHAKAWLRNQLGDKTR